MRITELLDKRSIRIDGAPKSKNEALDQMVELMAKSGKINDLEAYRQEVYRREEEGTTGVGEGIAIPHGKGAFVDKPGLAAMVVKDGVDYDSLDGEPVHLIFLIAAPNTKDNVHLDVLSKLSVLLMDEDFSRALQNAKSPEEFMKIVDEADQEAPDLDEKLKADEATSEDQFRILAVTACPTGIAHTYMAAEGLEKAAKAKGCFIKVETRGSGGAKNVLTAEEIKNADCIIVAADTKVPMDRFNGKKLIEVQVSDGISKADKLIEQAMSGNVPVYTASENAEVSEKKAGGSKGHQIYMQLMNGVSHMLPFVVGGGILIALAFLIDGLCVDMTSLTAEARQSFGSITPVAATLKSIGNLAFGFMLPVLAGFIAMSIADRPGLAVGFVGGAIAANGKSGFLGALVAGFLAGYLILLLKKLFEKLPEALEKIAPVLLYPVFGILIVGLVMTFVVEPPIGALNTALNTALTNMSGSSKVLLGIIVAGMMAVDMGGPFNKAAYVFGTASIAAGNYGIMAAVMIGGMVPPCAIALASLLFKDKFTKTERESAPTNFIMGLAFITEGAIPFAASDPLHVIPACVIGSGLAGALSMAFNCTLMAPHGGIFVFPVVGNPLMYLAALAVGTVVGALMLGVLKKKIAE
ncbi:MAG: fructose-specific PTS transporter subunit EIIC [Lachnospiraceae bacterium]|nr:PTS fructose transporter subunit IIC [Lachnospiraceae bacterium]